MSDGVNKLHNESPVGTVKTKVTMGAVVKRVDGSVEDLGEQSSQVVELSYDDAVKLLGQEHADDLFAGAERAQGDGTN